MTKNPYVRPTRTTIDLSALEANWNALFRYIPKTTGVLAVVKANGYGHGSVVIAKEYHRLGAVGVGVADVAEAIVLREGGYKGEILCLGATPRSALHEAAQRNIVVTVHTMETLASISEFSRATKERLRVHAKVDTGMCRLGFVEKEWTSAAEKLAQEPHLVVEGLFTHLAESENSDRAFTLMQLERFRKAQEIFDRCLGRRLVRHALNSGGILVHPEAHLDWVRPGLVLYGYPPSNVPEADRHFRPILDWRAPILQIKTIAPGDTVGYNRRFRATAKMKIAVVAAGYGDGYRRNYREVGIGFRNRRCRILGFVCMDLLMIDVTEFPDVRAGEEVFLLGKGQTGPSARELAASENSIVYEVLTGISARVSREFIRNVETLPS